MVMISRNAHRGWHSLGILDIMETYELLIYTLFWRKGLISSEDKGIQSCNACRFARYPDAIMLPF